MFDLPQVFSTKLHQLHQTTHQPHTTQPLHTTQGAAGTTHVAGAQATKAAGTTQAAGAGTTQAAGTTHVAGAQATKAAGTTQAAGVLGRPEVTGVSPREGPTSSETKLVIRGSNLGESASDVLSLTVAGVDCLASLEYESATRLRCLVGPLTSTRPTSGDVVVETRSGGVGISMVQFRFVADASGDDDQFAAVPYDPGESPRQQTGESPRPPASSFLRLTSAPGEMTFIVFCRLDALCLVVARGR